MAERLCLGKETDIRHRVGRWLATLHAWLPLPRQAHGFEAPRPETDLERMQRLAQWCLDGRRAAAELELHDWQRHRGAPATARVLLAALLAQRGRIEDALQIIRSSPREHLKTNPPTLQILLALLTAAGLRENARDLAEQLLESAVGEPVLAQWAQWINPGSDAAPSAPELAASRLAEELVVKPQVIVALVAGQRIKPQAASISLLRQALTLVLRHDVPRQVELTIVQALAELALLAGDSAAARRWAHHGLKIEPYRVSLALLLAQIDDDARVGPPAQEILTIVAAQHPDYPDVQATLIRRFQAGGRADDARNHLAWWLAHSPDNPHAQKIAQEIAA